MGEDSRGPSLPRRVPGANNAPTPRRQPARTAPRPGAEGHPVTNPPELAAPEGAPPFLPRRVPGASAAPRARQPQPPVLPASLVQRLRAAATAAPAAAAPAAAPPGAPPLRQPRPGAPPWDPIQNGRRAVSALPSAPSRNNPGPVR